MKNFLLSMGVLLFAISLNSCMVGSIVTAPVKVAGDVAQGTYNVGKGISKMGSGDN